MLEENPTASHGDWDRFQSRTPYQVAVSGVDARLHLMDDTAIGTMFYGTDCKLFQNTQLTVQRKNMDQ